MIDKTRDGSKKILDDCLASVEPCIESKVQGAYSVVYTPIRQQHPSCLLAYDHLIHEYKDRATGVSEGQYLFWIG